MTHSLQIAVVGAGVIGLCNALQLARQGHSVTLYDPAGIGEQCSRGNAGHFATEQVFPLADKALLPRIPMMLLDKLSPLRIDHKYFVKASPWLSRFCLNMLPGRFKRHTRALRALNESALAAFKRLLQEDFESNINLRGSLLTFEHDRIKEIRAIQHKYQQQGVAVELLDRTQLFALEPGLSRCIHYALYFTEVGHTSDPYQLSQALFQRFSALGGRYVKAEVCAITPLKEGSNSPELTQIKLTTQTHSCRTFDRLVLATGAWSKTLCAQLGYKLPIEAERGYHNMLPVISGLSRPVASADRQFIMTPMQNGLRLAGTVEFAGLDTRPNYERAQMLLTHARAILRDNDALQQGEHWMGPRPSLPDSLPVIGRAPNHPNIYFALGHQHLGLTQAAITSELIAQCIANQPTTLDIGPYSIARFQ
ncbi:NAD(P)/FAD-dependent oxidoreductase [Pseudoalteromonas rubra]|uniref:Amino acid dehydrogenase n=1 Tax=Pseudoalteromonas rubra TaxID=43658 RepID=A0A5S3X4V9_9GAMM|nr:FAD-binding oxidoreductase [Pseudoalteromonas rubra]TMP38977.1 amino acid dehydrogenase [Pseudoalteromonas rubra]